MSVREINVVTGEETVREYTPEEVAANAAAAAEAAAQIPPEPTKAELLAQINALMAKVQALS